MVLRVPFNESTMILGHNTFLCYVCQRELLCGVIFSNLYTLGRNISIIRDTKLAHLTTTAAAECCRLSSYEKSEMMAPRICLATTLTNDQTNCSTRSHTGSLHRLLLQLCSAIICEGILSTKFSLNCC